MARRQALKWGGAAIATALSVQTARTQSASDPVDAPVAPLALRVLGSGGPGATGRAGACYVVLLDGVARILLDAGPGAFARLGEAHLNIRQLDTVLLTHLHADHAGGLPGLIKARAVSSRGRIQFSVFGPDGHKAQNKNEGNFPSTTHFMDLLFGKAGAFEYLRDFAAPITFESRNVRRTTQVETLVQKDGLRIQVASGHHRDAPSLIYRVDYKGHSVTFSGDMDAEGHGSLVRMARGSDLLVFNAVVLDPPGSPEILYTLHSAPTDIGRLAQQAGVRRLLLGHLNPSIDDNLDDVQASIARSFAGPVQWATDGMQVAVLNR